MISREAKICVLTSDTWHQLLADSQDDPQVTVKKYYDLLRSYDAEMRHLFDQVTWEEQIEITIRTQNPVWASMLDSEQLAAYLIMKD